MQETCIRSRKDAPSHHSDNKEDPSYLLSRSTVKCCSVVDDDADNPADNHNDWRVSAGKRREGGEAF